MDNPRGATPLNFIWLATTTTTLTFPAAAGMSHVISCTNERAHRVHV